MATRDDPSPQDLALQRAKYLTGLIWHIGTFVIINAFLWFLDLATGVEGIQWAPWVTVFWGVGVLFHVLAWIVDGRQMERRKAEQYLAEQYLGEQRGDHEQREPTGP